MSEDWKVYENLENFKEYFCDWIDAIVDEGYKDDSKILAVRRVKWTPSQGQFFS